MAELESQYFRPFVHPDDMPAALSALAHASKKPLDYFEVRLRHKNGTYRWFAWRAAPEMDMVYANGRDITALSQRC